MAYNNDKNRNSNSYNKGGNNTGRRKNDYNGNHNSDNKRSFDGNKGRGGYNNGYKSKSSYTGGNNYKKNSSYKKGGKKPFNKNYVRKEPDRLVYLKYANPHQFMHEFSSLTDSHSGVLTAEDEKKAIGNIFHGYHLYRVYISASNRLVSGWSYMKVGFLEFHEEIDRSKPNLSSITMSFVPCDDLEYDEDTLNRIELAAYIAGKNLMSVYSKAVNFALPKLVAAGLSDEINKAGFNAAPFKLTSVYGRILDPTIYSEFTTYKGGVPIKMSIKSDTDQFIANYFANKFIIKSTVEFDNNAIVIKDATTKQTLAKIYKLKTYIPANKGKHFRTINYEILGRDPRLGNAIEEFIRAGIKNENKSHKLPFDPIDKIEIKDITSHN